MSFRSGKGVGQLAWTLLRQQGQSNGPTLAQAELTPLATEAAKSIGGCRHASQQAVKQRMKTVNNMQKITKAMKMVATSKLRKAQADTFESRGILEPLVKLLGDLPGADVEKNITVPISTDKGLCGGINSNVTKITKGTIRTLSGEERQNELVVIGDKCRGQLQRDLRDLFVSVIQDTQKARITFSLASSVADEVLKTEYDAARVIFNRFHSAISFKPTLATVLSPDAIEKEAEAGSSLDSYELEGPDRAELLQNLGEFQLAVVLYNGMQENNCSEQASRMSAMENSTKNASEILEKLTLSYNRSRQAAITTELTEIISGAAALEG